MKADRREARRGDSRKKDENLNYRANRRHHKVLQKFKSDLFGSSSRDSRVRTKVSRLPVRPAPAIESMEAEPDPEYLSPCIYQQFYGFNRPPFNNTPDPRFFFLSKKHSEGLSRLLYAAQARKGFVLLTGEIGSGKTTICRTLINKLRLTSRVALIANTSITSKQLIAFIAGEFNLPTDGKSKGEIITELNKFLIKQLSMDRNVLLVLDEAQNLDNPVLEEIRMLSNLETTQEKLIQIFLVGQPELRDKVNSPDMKQLKQRISLRYHVRPLDRLESEEYIAHRLHVANAVCAPRFTPHALDEIFGYSEGIPRLINTVCDNALVVGFTRETVKIGGDIVQEVVADMEGLPQPEADEDRSGGFFSRLRTVIGGRR